MKGLQILADLKPELLLVEEELQKIASTPDDILSRASSRLLQAGGKRLRPAFAIIAARSYRYQREKVIPLAAALELIHMATLIHDDVVDASLTRRGQPTVKALWGNQISVYTGDYLFAHSLMLIARCQNPVIAKVLAEVSVKMCEGEIQQLSTAFRVDQGLRDYFYRIKCKTALLISASCRLGAEAVGAPPGHCFALGKYGLYIGMAFQITDDILDVIADQEELGKPVGGDLRQGILTLPVLYTLRVRPGDSELRRLLQKKEKSEEEIRFLLDLIKSSGGVEYAFEVARMYVTKAKSHLTQLPSSQAKEALYEMADFVLERKF